MKAARKKDGKRASDDDAAPQERPTPPAADAGAPPSAPLPEKTASLPARRRSAVTSREWIAASCDGVIDIVAALFGVSGRELRGAGRSTVAVSRVRQIAMYVAHVRLHLSMREVGQGFGRDRTTVLYACHQIEDLREDEEFDAIVARVELVVQAAFTVWANRGMTAA